MTYRLENEPSSNATCFRTTFEATTQKAAIATAVDLLAVELNGEEPMWGSFTDGTVAIAASGRTWWLTEVKLNEATMSHGVPL